MLKKIQESSHILLDIKYATKDNFVKKKLYQKPLCYLHNDAYKLLIKASNIARKNKLKLKIFDAYRPLEIQKTMYLLNQEFVSDPQYGSIPHCRGVAIDLTLIDEHNNELDMGTKFDNFTSLAHHGNCEISVKAQKNRLLLLDIMTQAGWDYFEKEWWHYQLFEARKYEIIKDFSI